MFVHGENSTFFRLLIDPDPDAGKDAGDSSGVPSGGSFRSFEPLMLSSVCFCSISSLRDGFFREVVVGGLGGSTLNPADIVGKGERRRAYSYTSVAQDIGRKTQHAQRFDITTKPTKKRKVVDQCQLQESTHGRSLLNAVSRVNQKNANVKASALPGAKCLRPRSPRNESS